MKILVTGGAGFIGTNLCKKLIEDQGHDVIVLDNLSSSKRFPPNTKNINIDVKSFNEHIFELFDYHVDQIYHLACQASPPRYQADPIDTIMTNVVGTKNMLDFARYHNAKILFTSTSEVYGDPKEHPQHEEYLGNVNCVGPRACYDEGKRTAETLCYDYQRRYGTDVRVARIFNTFGPHMDLEDGRVVTNFISQMIQGKKVTIYGKGTQTRSFCYVDDMVDGLITLMKNDYTQPINLGNPDEISINQLAQEIATILKCDPNYKYIDLPKDDPKIRRPNITRAKEILGWKPQVSRIKGLKKTIKYFKKELNVV